MAWVCSKCTFLNPPSQRLTCQICLSSSSSCPSSSSSSSSPSNPPLTWSCNACALSNTFSDASCQICGTRPKASLLSIFEDLDSPDPDDELGSSVGSTFLPLQPCKGKNQDTVEVGDSFSELGKSQEVKSSREAETFLGDINQDASFSTLKVLSYNVWFREDLEVHKRMKALGDLIQQHLPDLICFQEVTPYIYGIFQHANWWKLYTCSVPSEMANERRYFCMLLSKLRIKSLDCKPFRNSIMGRELCMADIEVGMGKSLVLATSHLESPCPAPPKWDQMYSKERLAQAKEALNLLKDTPNVIFGGDLNWIDELDGEFPLLEGWVDAWVELKPGENGWTYDTKSNQMLSANRTVQKRLDRFVCKLHDFKINAVDMIGMEAIPGLSYCKERRVRRELQKLVLPVLPSDHYGLLLTISNM